MFFVSPFEEHAVYVSDLRVEGYFTCALQCFFLLFLIADFAVFCFCFLNIWQTWGSQRGELTGKGHVQVYRRSLVVFVLLASSLVLATSYQSHCAVKTWAHLREPTFRVLPCAPLDFESGDFREDHFLIICQDNQIWLIYEFNKFWSAWPIKGTEKEH